MGTAAVLLLSSILLASPVAAINVGYATSNAGIVNVQASTTSVTLVPRQCPLAA